MNDSIASSTDKVNTEELFASDKYRDSKHSALKLFLRGHIIWNKNGLGKKAEKIYKIVKQHGLSMTNESYLTQSNLSSSLLTEFKKPENKAMLKDLTLTELVTDYDNAESSFKDLYRKTMNLEAAKESYVAASILKKEVFKLQKETVEYLNVMHKLNPEKYDEVSAVIAELVNTLNQKLRTRYNN